MSDQRLRPRGVTPSTTNGDVLTTVGGVAAWAAVVVPVQLAPMVSIDENGNPGLIFDENGNIYRTAEG